MKAALSNLFKSKPPYYSLQNLLHQLGIVEKHTNLSPNTNQAPVIEALRIITELYLYGDQNKLEEFWNTLLEKDALSTYSQILRNPNATYPLMMQVMQSMNILVHNLRDKNSIYYVLSSAAVHAIVAHPFDFKGQDELLLYYLSMIKTLVSNMDKVTIQFFFRMKAKASDERAVEFPMYERVSHYLAHPDNLMRTAVRAITLGIFKEADEDIMDYIVTQRADQFFTLVVNHIKSYCMLCNDALSDPSVTNAKSKTDPVCAEIVDNFDYCEDVFGLGIDPLSEILADKLNVNLLQPLVYPSLHEPDAVTHSGRILPQLALFLVAQLFHLITVPRVIRSITESSIYPPIAQGPSTLDLLRQRASSQGDSPAKKMDVDTDSGAGTGAGEEDDEEGVVEEDPYAGTNSPAKAKAGSGDRGEEGEGGETEGTSDTIATDTPPLTPSGVDVKVDADGVLSQALKLPSHLEGGRSRVYSAPPLSNNTVDDTADGSGSDDDETFYDADAGPSDGDDEDGSGEGGEGKKKLDGKGKKPQHHGGPKGVILGCLLSSREEVVVATVFVLHALLRNKAADPKLLGEAGFLPRPAQLSRRLMDALTHPPPSPASMTSSATAATDSSAGSRERSRTDANLAMAAAAAVANPSPKSGAAYPVELVGILMRFFQMRSPFRLATVRLAVALVFDLLDDQNSERIHLIPDHIALVNLAHSLSLERLREARMPIDDDEFLDMYFDSLNKYENASLRRLFHDLTFDSGVLNVTNGTDLWSTLPSDERQQVAFDMQFFFVMHELREYTLKVIEKLPSPKLTCSTQVGAKLDASSQDYIACQMLSRKDNRMARRYLLTDERPFLIIVEPDTASMHSSFVRIVIPLMHVKVSVDKRDGRVLFVQTRPHFAQPYNPFALLHFDDPMRCIAARDHLEGKRFQVRKKALEDVERVVGVNPRRRSTSLEPPVRANNYFYY